MPSREKLEEMRWDLINEERHQREDAENALAEREAAARIKRRLERTQQGSLPGMFVCPRCHRDLHSAHSMHQHNKFCKG